MVNPFLPLDLEATQPRGRFSILCKLIEIYGLLHMIIERIACQKCLQVIANSISLSQKCKYAGRCYDIKMRKVNTNSPITSPNTHNDRPYCLLLVTGCRQYGHVSLIPEIQGAKHRV